MLATTLLDRRAAPAAELAALCHERREIETARDEVKTRILGPGAALRGKTPDLVFQEIDGLLLAHCGVRRLIHEAAEEAAEDSRPIALRARRACHAPPDHQSRRLSPGGPAGVIDEILEGRAVSSRGQAAGLQAEDERLPPPQARSGVALAARPDARNHPELCSRQQCWA